MFVELLMKKNGKIIFALFLILTVAASIFGGVLVYDAMNTDIYKFTKDGYALTFSTENNTKALKTAPVLMYTSQGLNNEGNYTVYLQTWHDLFFF